MVDSFSSAWLELAIAGLITSLVCNVWLSWEQSPGACAPALARGASGRAALLRETCTASDSGWARLLRAALREAGRPTEGGAGYRDAAPRGPSREVSQLFTGELSRIRRVAVIGLASAAAVLLATAMLARAQPVAMGVLVLGAVAIGWRVLANARAATAALVTAHRALPELAAALVPPPPPPLREPRAGARAPTWERVQSRSFMGFVFLGLLAIPAAGLAAEATHPVDASKLATLITVHVFVVPFAIAATFLLRTAYVAVDAARDEVLVVRRLVGIAYARASVPLEIVHGFSVQKVRSGRASVSHVIASTSTDPIQLVDGDRAEEAAAALDRALGETSSRSREFAAQPTK